LQPSVQSHDSSLERGSKAFGLHQRDDEISAEADGDEQAEDGFEHQSLLFLRARQRMGVNRHDAEQAEAESEEESILHGFAPFSGFGAKMAQTAIRFRWRSGARHIRKS
jgi:hypothetical protein